MFADFISKIDPKNYDNLPSEEFQIMIFFFFSVLTCVGNCIAVNVMQKKSKINRSSNMFYMLIGFSFGTSIVGGIICIYTVIGLYPSIGDIIPNFRQTDNLPQIFFGWILSVLSFGLSLSWLYEQTQEK